MARPTPVFPLVASTMVPPGLSSPRFSACSMMNAPTRSLTDPPGFMNSNFAYSGTGKSLPILASRTSGVFPIAPNTLSYTRFSVETGKVILTPLNGMRVFYRSKEKDFLKSANKKSHAKSLQQKFIISTSLNASILHSAFIIYLSKPLRPTIRLKLNLLIIELFGRVSNIHDRCRLGKKIPFDHHRFAIAHFKETATFSRKLSYGFFSAELIGKAFRHRFTHHLGEQAGLGQCLLI